MLHFLLCAATFLSAYAVNTTVMTVCYHRALTHGALRLSPRARAFIARHGVWITGLDPLTWCCMHRLHHLHSDAEGDPHSPVHHGILGLFVAQARAYVTTMKGLAAGGRRYVSVVRDLDFPVHWIHARRGLWLAPHLVQLLVGLSLARAAHLPALGACYYVGLLSAPVGGWLVNALGHSRGYRNFDTRDESRNNRLVAWLVAGEGYQNNHHARPARASFAARPGERDPGYALCRLVAALGLAEIASDANA